MRRKPTVIDAELLAHWPLPDADASESKQDRGMALIVAGSRHVPGAALLAALGAMRSGAGKLQIATVASAACAMGLALPEAAVFGLKESKAGEVSEISAQVKRAARQADALLMGPGQQQTAARGDMTRALLRAVHCPVVLDAGALPSRRFEARTAMVLTPHAGEMAALLQLTLAEVRAEPLAAARAAARHFGAIVALKGPTTYIVDAHGEAWVQHVDAPGLGISGSGDVLAGVITGLLARGAEPTQAVIWGVWLHGQAGVRCAQRVGKLGYVAREIADQVPGICVSARQS